MPLAYQVLAIRIFHFYYHTSTPIGSLPVRSRQLLRTKFSSFSTILRLFSLEAFQRRRASSLVNCLVVSRKKRNFGD